ncbi:ABC transporter ATP-binding protein [Kamptonema cortianum]|nr:ABC transporter ATP-binding protein [Kamptonema cortianum]MDL5044514.1 ABC transporter ATP-binding protein [Oscillatoria amoena NRMC-F 0135]
MNDTREAQQPLLDVRHLRIHFQDGDQTISAVDDVSFTLEKGETLAVVGESGSGKSVTALSITRLIPSPPAIYAGGEILFRGRNTLTMPPNELRSIRGRKISYIFQEPSSSLNPVFRIRTQIAEVLKLHRPEVKDVDAEIIRLLEIVGIKDPALRYKDYPHQLSGGMQQRVMIAMALACKPDLLVADEPTTALDVTIQAQILELLRELKKEIGMSVILITHNFSIISGIADKVAVMFRGKIVEFGPAAEVIGNPQHPYTQALIECVPRLGARAKRLKTIDYEKVDA